MQLEDLKKDLLLEGIDQSGAVRLVAVETIGNDAVTVYYRTGNGQIREQMLTRIDEPRLILKLGTQAWSFDAPGDQFKLAVEAFRIHLAHLFDPMMAVHTSNVEPLPHQISAVYESMLPRQPLRYVLADDPGAGKTIMAGLFIRELMMRADAQRILIVTPGSLVEQWQDELYEKFGLDFDIFSREVDETSRSGNAFQERNLLIARLDQLSRSEDLQQKLKSSEWDLIVVDEAHKLSASYFGQELRRTKRFELGELLGEITRHFLLMTATPHSGKEESFQLFMSLLDKDRFLGRFRNGPQRVDVSDLMRRMVKEELLKFDGTRLFPERKAYTVIYELSPLESDLYSQVTDYVRMEMNRADELDGKRRGTVGFALTLLQRRLASSPEAIFQSLKRRRKKLEDRLKDQREVDRGHRTAETLGQYDIERDLPDDPFEAEDELSSEQFESWSENVVDQATAARTLAELQNEINSLKVLEEKALAVVRSGQDRKWNELNQLLQDRPEMYDSSGGRRKLIIFTEHKDTLNYLRTRIQDMLGRQGAVVEIHGGISRDERRRTQEEFRNNPDVMVLVATDAAGEGVNLQNASLMINYDLPWNPNRIEQRFGRIHRIGQTEVCHLWNMVAQGTREGEVFHRLFDKLEIERAALGGRVFDILGEAFDNTSLKDLLIEAIRYGERPETKAKLKQVIEGALDTNHLRAVMERNALCEEHMSLQQLYAIKGEMEKAEARKLQPYFIRSFFTLAFGAMGGELRLREPGRYEIPYIPAKVRERDRTIGVTRTPVAQKYERVCFEKQQVHLNGKPMASLLHPGHPLMRAVLDLVLEQNGTSLRQGSILVDPSDESITPKVLFMLDHSIRQADGGDQHVVSRRLQFVGMDEQGHAFNAGWAPHLDLQPLDDQDRKLVSDVLESGWLTTGLEARALEYASESLVPEHFQEVKQRRERQVDKVLAAVQDRLVREIDHWQDRYIKLSEQVAAGKQPRLQPENARRKVEELSARLEERKKELTASRHVVSGTPIVLGGVLVIPRGLLAQQRGETSFSTDAESRKRIEAIAMQAVTAAENKLGHAVTDVSDAKCGWDLTAQPPIREGILPDARHIEVKGRAKGQTTITVTRNEILMGLNQGSKFMLAVVVVDGDTHEGPFYIRQPFSQEPEFGVDSQNWNLQNLLSKAVSAAETTK